MIIRASLVFLLLLINSVVMAVNLASVVVQNNTGNTSSILCSLSGAYSQKVFLLNHPDRVVVDFKQTSTTLNAQQIHIPPGLIMGVRSGHPNPQTLRLVFELRQGVKLRTPAWQPTNRALRGFRLDLEPVGKYIPSKTALKATNIKLATQALPPHHQDKPVKTPARMSPRPMRDVVVVLDPGHGGKDAGAMGMGRSAEKNVVLAIALKLKQLIDRQPGMRAVLTRDGDYYVGLRERMTIARRYNADVFIAIHADAFTNHASNGASVFALSPRGATSEAARWLAEKENHSELGGVNLSGLDDQNGAIRTVLLDLSQTATIGASLQMGGRVLRGLGSMTRLHNANVEQARFVVLKSPDIPSILIETGFISNPSEEKNLNSPAYQARLTQAIFQGIKGYFWDYPPHGTRVEAMSGGGMHWVQAGETLPIIAKRYHVSVSQLQSANHLQGLALNPGQKLSIPVSWS